MCSSDLYNAALWSGGRPRPPTGARQRLCDADIPVREKIHELSRIGERVEQESLSSTSPPRSHTQVKIIRLMQPARIAELLTPFLKPTPAAATSNLCHSEPASAGEESAFLSESQLDHISTYIDILLRWNSRINLTAIRDPEEIVTRHFGESLFVARHLFPHTIQRDEGQHLRGRAALQRRVKEGEKHGASAPEVHADDKKPTVADLGSGAGFPGIPIKLWAPDISLTLIESNHKKATFLREVARAITLTNVNILNARAETLPPSSHNVVTLRVSRASPRRSPSPLTWSPQQGSWRSSSAQPSKKRSKPTFRISLGERRQLSLSRALASSGLVGEPRELTSGTTY